MMKAAWFNEFGPADKVLVVGSRPLPELQAGEVLVRLSTSGVNPSDVKKRAGSFPDLLDGGWVTPHSDGAGVIKAVGAGVSDARIGERVWVYQAQYGRRFGTAAEYLAISSCRAAALPEGIGYEVGACLGIPAMTAHRCVFADGPIRGHTVVITGGAGRVGHYAVQMASQAGARVIATASRDTDAQSCMTAGACATVNHRNPDWASEVLSLNGGRRVERVIDVEFGANLSHTLKLIKPGSTIVTYSSTRVSEPILPFLQMLYLDLCVRFVIVYAMPEAAKRSAIADINALLTADKLQHRVAHLLPLADITRAHELIETGGVRGAVIVTMN